VQPMPMLTCTSVSGSSDWYQRVLGLVSGHGGDEYEMLTAGEGGPLVLQLHEVDAHEHGHLVRDGQPLGGNGVAIWFETDDFAERRRAHPERRRGRARGRPRQPARQPPRDLASRPGRIRRRGEQPVRRRGLTVRYPTLLFDLDHTLFDFDASELHAFEAALAVIGIDEHTAHFPMYQRLNTALWAAAERGEIRSNQIRNRRFEQLCTELGLDADQATVAAMADAFVHGLGANGDLYPGALDVLDELATIGSTMAIVSNGLGEVVHARIERLVSRARPDRRGSRSTASPSRRRSARASALPGSARRRRAAPSGRSGRLPRWRPRSSSRRGRAR
jgi:hypothetical protein